MRNKKYPIMNMGIASILTVFVVLCMVTFAVLSYVSAGKDASFAQQFADRNTAYYTASAEANRQIAEIAETLTEHYENGTYDELPESYTVTVPVDDSKNLEVVLQVCDPAENDGAYYEITVYQEVSAEEWEGDTSLPVLQQ